MNPKSEDNELMIELKPHPDYTHTKHLKLRIEVKPQSHGLKTVVEPSSSITLSLDSDATAVKLNYKCQEKDEY